MTESRFESRPDLRISLLGPFDVQIDGSPMPRVRSRKEHWLLALLVLRGGREVRRDWLAETLWPNSRIDQSRAYLRLSLYLLKQALGPQAVRLQSPTVHTLRLDLNGAEVDVIAFDAAIARGDIESLQAALSLYKGPFLEGCTEAWAVNEQRVREHHWLGALEQAAENERARGRLREACCLLQRLIRQDPLRESAHRALMQALADVGDYAAMTTAYRDLRILLQQEVNAGPSPESVALYDALRSRALHTSEIRHASEPGKISAPLEVPWRQEKHGAADKKVPAPDSSRFGVAPFGPLPRPLTPLIGRLDVVQEIAACLQIARLVTLTGTGGVGKTRLALQLAQEWSQTGGVWFVELAALTSPSLLVQTVAAVCQLVEEPGRSLEETLERYLADYPGLLLVLDNCEHLLRGCAGLAGSLLHSCPELRILATSRQGLGIAGETLFPVPTLEAPMAAPAPKKATEVEWLAHLRGYEAIRLYEERARAVMPAFRLTTQNAAAVLEICRHLDGIPLAIELAAAWITVLTPEQMLARLTEHRFDLLVSRRRDPEARHRSLWATLDASSQLLEPDLRQFLGCLSVFRGGWTLEAAEAVCLPPLQAPAIASRGGRALESLALLQERSLIQTTSANGTMRYFLLETVREYASKLLSHAEREAVSQAHASYCLALAEQGAPHLIGPQQVYWLDRLEEEQYNMRAALDWCAHRETETETGFRLCTALWRFWDVRSHHQEGIDWLSLFHSRGESASMALRGRGREAMGLLYAGIQESERACGWSLDALEIYTMLGDSMGIARTLCTLGISETNLTRIESARARFEICLPVLMQSDDAYERGRALSAQGTLEQVTGAFDAARSLLQQSADSYRTCGHLRGVALTLHRLGGIALIHKQLDRARRLFGEALALTRVVQDRTTLPFALFHLGRISILQQDFDAAQIYLNEAVVCSRANHNHVVEGTCLVLLGDIASQEQDVTAACAFYFDALTPYNRPETAGAVAIVGARLASLALYKHQAADALRLQVYASLHVTRLLVQDPPHVFLLFMSLGYLYIDRDAFEAEVAALRRLLPDDFESIRQEAQAMSLSDAVTCIRRLVQQLC
ncbi:MAG: hypothetical protein JWL77_6454 [Chthonomonadaceae bacterium]|nr:hypothetical protein [Chthonomonadaceae bacterium]